MSNHSFCEGYGVAFFGRDSECRTCDEANLCKKETNLKMTGGPTMAKKEMNKKLAAKLLKKAKTIKKKKDLSDLAKKYGVEIKIVPKDKAVDIWAKFAHELKRMLKGGKKKEDPKKAAAAKKKEAAAAAAKKKKEEEDDDLDLDEDEDDDLDLDEDEDEDEDEGEADDLDLDEDEDEDDDLELVEDEDEDEDLDLDEDEDEGEAEDLDEDEDEGEAEDLDEDGDKSKSSISELELRIKALEGRVAELQEKITADPAGNVKGKAGPKKMDDKQKKILKRKLLEKAPYKKAALVSMKSKNLRILASAFKINSFGKKGEEIITMILKAQKKMK